MVPEKSRTYSKILGQGLIGRVILGQGLTGSAILGQDIVGSLPIRLL